MKHLIAFLIFLILTLWIIHDIQEANKKILELDKFGSLTKGCVIKVEYLENTSTIKCSYIFNNKRYEGYSSELSCMKKIHPKDTLWIIVSKIHPNVFRYSKLNCAD